MHSSFSDKNQLKIDERYAQVYVYWLTMSWSIFHRIDCEHNKNVVREIVKEVGCAKFTRKHIESKDQN